MNKISSAPREFLPANIAVITISDTRTLENDKSGQTLADRVTGAGHMLADRLIVKDEIEDIRAAVRGLTQRDDIDVVITTGGTGLTGRDVTPEALARIRESNQGKDIPGFGELFRLLSYRTIGTSTIQSRALGMLARGKYIFALPGSNGAVKDGWDGILAEQLDSRNRPCNFVELMPRLREV